MREAHRNYWRFDQPPTQPMNPTTRRLMWFYIHPSALIYTCTRFIYTHFTPFCMYIPLSLDASYNVGGIAWHRAIAFLNHTEPTILCHSSPPTPPFNAVVHPFVCDVCVGSTSTIVIYFPKNNRTCISNNKCAFRASGNWSSMIQGIIGKIYGGGGFRGKSEKTRSGI